MEKIGGWWNRKSIGIYYVRRRNFEGNGEKHPEMAIQRKVLYTFPAKREKSGGVTFKKLILEDILGDLHLRMVGSGECRKAQTFTRRFRSVVGEESEKFPFILISSSRGRSFCVHNFLITVKRGTLRCKSLHSPFRHPRLRPFSILKRWKVFWRS